VRGTTSYPSPLTPHRLNHLHHPFGPCHSSRKSYTPLFGVAFCPSYYYIRAVINALRSVPSRGVVPWNYRLPIESR